MDARPRPYPTVEELAAAARRDTWERLLALLRAFGIERADLGRPPDPASLEFEAIAEAAEKLLEAASAALTLAGPEEPGR